MAGTRFCPAETLSRKGKAARKMLWVWTRRAPDATFNLHVHVATLLTGVGEHVVPINVCGVKSRLPAGPFALLTTKTLLLYRDLQLMLVSIFVAESHNF
jgi:hypothetical protein